MDLEREQQAERLMTEANLWRTRGNPEKAEACAGQAVEVAPEHAGARELHGDMLQLLGELEQALEEYRESLRLEPHRPSAETRFARVTLALAAEAARTASDSSDPEAILKRESSRGKKKSPAAALVWSLTLPGAGQFYNEEREKGAIILGVWIVSVLVLLLPTVKFVLQLLSSFTDSALPAGAQGQSFWGPLGTVLFMGIAVYSAMEAYLVAKRRAGIS